MPTYRIHFSGLVQGVGFRATCQRLARRLTGLAGQVCNRADGRVLRSFQPGHLAGVTYLAFSPDSKSLATGSADTTVLLWDLGDGK